MYFFCEIVKKGPNVSIWATHEIDIFMTLIWAKIAELAKNVSFIDLFCSLHRLFKKYPEKKM